LGSGLDHGSTVTKRHAPWLSLLEGQEEGELHEL
jgi:hypothetical protein